MHRTAPAHRPNHPARKPSVVALPDHYRSLVRRIDSKSFQVIGLPEGHEDPMFHDRAQAETWLSTHLPKLAKQMKRGQRPCLCCTTPFISEGPQNRMCDHCRKNDGATDWRETA